MKKTTLSILGSTAFLFLAASTSTFAAKKFDGAKYLKQATVTLKDAQKIAKKAFPGSIVDQELEKEGGGSGLRYSFVIKNGHKSHEVGVDAKTGALLENSVEGPNAD